MRRDRLVRLPVGVAVVTRLPIGLQAAGGWRDTFLPLPAGPGSWTNVLTGEPVTTPFQQLADVLGHHPAALRSPVHANLSCRSFSYGIACQRGGHRASDFTANDTGHVGV